LRDDRLDFVVLPEGYQSGLPADALFEDPWVCCVWDRHPGVGDELSLEQYLAMEHVIFMPGPGKRVASRPLVSATDLKRTAVASVESFALLPFLLRGTELVALVPERLAVRVAGMAEIRILKSPHAVRPVRQTLCWNPRRSNDGPHQWMRDLIVDSARQL
jgi:DNA-binding transcriptional LysR family regulator